MAWKQKCNYVCNELCLVLVECLHVVFRHPIEIAALALWLPKLIKIVAFLYPLLITTLLLLLVIFTIGPQLEIIHTFQEIRFTSGYKVCQESHGELDFNAEFKEQAGELLDNWPHCQEVGNQFLVLENYARKNCMEIDLDGMGAYKGGYGQSKGIASKSFAVSKVEELLDALVERLGDNVDFCFMNPLDSIGEVLFYNAERSPQKDEEEFSPPRRELESCLSDIDGDSEEQRYIDTDGAFTSIGSTFVGIEGICISNPQDDDLEDECQVEEMNPNQESSEIVANELSLVSQTTIVEEVHNVESKVGNEEEQESSEIILYDKKDDDAYSEKEENCSSADQKETSIFVCKDDCHEDHETVANEVSLASQIIVDKDMHNVESMVCNEEQLKEESLELFVEVDRDDDAYSEKEEKRSSANQKETSICLCKDVCQEVLEIVDNEVSLASQNIVVKEMHNFESMVSNEEQRQEESGERIAEVEKDHDALSEEEEELRVSCADQKETSIYVDKFENPLINESKFSEDITTRTGESYRDYNSLEQVHFLGKQGKLFDLFNHEDLQSKEADEFIDCNQSMAQKQTKGFGNATMKKAPDASKDVQSLLFDSKNEIDNRNSCDDKLDSLKGSLMWDNFSPPKSSPLTLDTHNVESQQMIRRHRNAHSGPLSYLKRPPQYLTSSVMLVATEEMDHLWEEYHEMSLQDAGLQREDSVPDSFDVDSSDYCESDMETSQVCCLQALKFSRGKMPWKKPSIKKISKALKKLAITQHFRQHKTIPIDS